MNNHDPFYFEFLDELFYRNEKSFATSIETIILCFFNSVIDDWCNSYSFRLFKNCSRYFEQEANQVINSNQDYFLANQMNDLKLRILSNGPKNVTSKSHDENEIDEDNDALDQTS